MMLILIYLTIFVAVVSSAPEYDLHGLDLYSSPLLKAAPIISPQLLHAPIHAPIYAPPAPIYAPAPILAPAPTYLKTIAPIAPVIKTIAPATSYATVTQYHVGHPAPIVKTLVAAPQILKSYYPAPISLGHGYPAYH